MKALVGSLNQEKALVGAFYVIVKTDSETDGSFHSTRCNTGHGPAPAPCGGCKCIVNKNSDTTISAYPWYLNANTAIQPIHANVFLKEKINSGNEMRVFYF